jgi:glycosyltransferase involved in cell wall biosynthesis
MRTESADTPGHSERRGLLLSIIVPFFNSAGKMDRLAATLAALSDPDVECVFVDDGSTDETRNHLVALKAAMQCPCTLITQANAGPGAARNHGFRHAQGKYVWFVDSDDDINPQAIAVLRGLDELDYDFIDFAVQHFMGASGPIRPTPAARANALPLPQGAYRAGEVTRLFLLHSVGWPWTKVFRREFLLTTRLTYPEHCIYEDTPWYFWLPFVADRFYKSAAVAYYHHQERESVTRSVGQRPYRFYDRLLTASLSVEMLNGVSCMPEERRRIEDKFTNMFLVHTVQMLRLSGEWGMIVRVVRFYREEVMRLGIARRSARRALHKLAALMPLWLMSYCYPSQSKYFQNIHEQAWGRDIVLAPPRLSQGLSPE